MHNGSGRYVARAKPVTSRVMPTDAEIRAGEAVRQLLASHRLDVPPVAADMLTNTVLKCRVLARREERMATELPRRKRMQRALKHARKLLQYTQHKPSHASSIPAQIKRLHNALNDVEVVVWLALARPRIDVPALLARHGKADAGGLNPNVLVRALEFYLSQKGKRSGRPKGRSTAVVTGGCIAWFQGRRKLTVTWNEIKGRTTGPLSSFVRDFLQICRLTMKEGTLYSALRVAVPYIKNHPNLRLPSAERSAK